MRTKAEVLQEHYGTHNEHDIWPICDADTDFMSPQPPLNRWITMKLPYEAPNHPGIPSIEEIEKAMQENLLTQSGGLFPVCRVGKCVVKRSADKCILQEADNLLYLQENSQVRTPKLYAAFIRHEGKYEVCYLITEFIEGETLTPEIWGGLDNRAQDIICSKFTEQLQLLRSIPSEGYYGRVHRQGWDPLFPLLRIRCKDMCGPYDSVNDFLSAMYTTAELRLADSLPSGDFLDHEREFLLKFKKILGNTSGAKPLLTHLDVRFENIIIRPIIEPVEEVIEDWEVTLIDWETLGWLPSFMQFAAIRNRTFVQHEASWTRRIFANFKESYEAEVEFLLAARRSVDYDIL